MTMETTGVVGLRVPLLSFSPPQVSGHDLGARKVSCHSRRAPNRPFIPSRSNFPATP